jgi:hypothetical protein
MRCCSPSLRPAAFPPPSPPAICGRLCSRLHRYYAAVRLLAFSTAASPLRLPVAARPRHGGLGEMRSPRFRRVAFMRNGVSDRGRVVAPRKAVRNMLPSAFATASASAGLSLSGLNIPLHLIAVYSSWPSSPPPTQHSLQDGSLLPYPGPDFLRLDRANFAWRTANRLSRPRPLPAATRNARTTPAGRSARSTSWLALCRSNVHVDRSWYPWLIRRRAVADRQFAVP